MKKKSSSGNGGGCCLFRMNFLLGLLLGNISLIAWSLGIQAGYNVFERNNTNTDDDTTTSFGLLGYHLDHSASTTIGGEDDEYSYLKYTVQQEDLFVDWRWRLGRYLYFILGVVGLLQCQLLWVSFCGGAWPILSNNQTKQRRSLALISVLLAVLPLAIACILYTSQLCQSTAAAPNNDRMITLEYVETSEGKLYSTTATWESINGTDVEEKDGGGGEVDVYPTYDGGDDNNNTCTPTDGAMALWVASALWLFCGLLLVVCCTPSSSSSSSSRRQFNKNGNKHNNTTTTTMYTPLLTPEPLLDPATRTLGWVAKSIVLTLFATVPYWTQAALVAMAPRDIPFNQDAVAGEIPNTQLLGPNMFDPTQGISYSGEQREWIDPAFEVANVLAWVPFAINLCLGLPLVLYGRHQLSLVVTSTKATSPWQCWPYLIFVLILVQFVSAAVCVWIPISVMQDLCHAKRYPELLFEDSGDGVWTGTTVAHHSAMTTQCWPTELGQILVIGGTLLSLLQAGLLLWFSLQYANAKDTLATFAGIEEDQRKLLGGGDSSDMEDQDDEEDEFV
jgi:hypothetical protein